LGSWIDASSIFTSLLILILFSTGLVIPVSAQTFVGEGCKIQVITDLVSELLITNEELIPSTLITWNDDCVATLLELANSDETKVYEAIQKFLDFQALVDQLPGLYTEGLTYNYDNQLVAGALNFAIQKHNEFCVTSLDLEHVEEIFKLMFLAQSLGNDTPENNLDQGSIQEDLCLQVEIIDFDYPLSTPEGSLSSISIRAAHFIGDNGPFFDPPLMIRGSYSWDLIPHYIKLDVNQPLSLDSEGRYAKSIMMPDGASKMYGSIQVYYPTLEFFSKNQNFEISSDEITEATEILTGDENNIPVVFGEPSYVFGFTGEFEAIDKENTNNEISVNLNLKSTMYVFDTGGITIEKFVNPSGTLSYFHPTFECDGSAKSDIKQIEHFDFRQGYCKGSQCYKTFETSFDVFDNIYEMTCHFYNTLTVPGACSEQLIYSNSEGEEVICHYSDCLGNIFVAPKPECEFAPLAPTYQEPASMVKYSGLKKFSKFPYEMPSYVQGTYVAEYHDDDFRGVNHDAKIVLVPHPQNNQFRLNFAEGVLLTDFPQSVHSLLWELKSYSNKLTIPNSYKICCSTSHEVLGIDIGIASGSFHDILGFEQWAENKVNTGELLSLSKPGGYHTIQKNTQQEFDVWTEFYWLTFPFTETITCPSCPEPTPKTEATSEPKVGFEEDTRVPSWIKNNAKWWSDGQIGDTDFVSGIQFMIKEKIIDIPDLPEQASETAEEKVPDWIKNNAGWWADGLISEEDFVAGIKWLVENGVIRV